MKGEILGQVGPLNITKEGLIYCLLLTVKSNAIIVALITLTATMPVFTMGRTMGAIGVPLKVVNFFIFALKRVKDSAL
jgi:cobalt/nickel transport system permease protein